MPSDLMTAAIEDDEGGAAGRAGFTDLIAKVNPDFYDIIDRMCHDRAAMTGEGVRVVVDLTAVETTEDAKD